MTWTLTLLFPHLLQIHLSYRWPLGRLFRLQDHSTCTSVQLPLNSVLFSLEGTLSYMIFVTSNGAALSSQMLSSETLSWKGWCHAVFMCSHFHMSLMSKATTRHKVTLDEYCGAWANTDTKHRAVEWTWLSSECDWDL